MSTPLTAAIITRLEKAAIDNGFDQELPRQGDWLGFASTQAPLRVWLTTLGDGLFIVALSQLHVARSLVEYDAPVAAPLPAGAAAGRAAADTSTLHYLLRRAFQLSKTLPNELLHVYEKQVRALPRTTEVERLVIQRVGQDIFRTGLIEFWEGRCAITGLSVTALLRASHIKPWAACANDAERLDVFNGLLLAPHMDAAFDMGFITINDNGCVEVSQLLSVEDRRILGLECSLRIARLDDHHRHYLSYHRETIFKARVSNRQSHDEFM